MEKEQMGQGGSETLCEGTALLEKIDGPKNEEVCEFSDSNKIYDNQEVIIISQNASDNYNVQDMDLEIVVLEEEKGRVSGEVENNSPSGVTTVEGFPTRIPENKEVSVRKNKEKPRQEIDFVSDDAKENSDNFDAKWNDLRSLSTKEDRYSFIRKRWGNSVVPDPSVDLTYRHRKTRVSLRGRKRGQERSSRKKNKARSLSCVSHMEKLINDVKANYYSELKKLCERHCLVVSDMQKRYHSEFVSLMQYSIHNMHFDTETAQKLLLKQRQDEMLQADNYQRQIQNLVRKTNSSLERYEKNSEEILVFHKQYQASGNGLLKKEQFLHLQETERMYKEYGTFYC